MTPFFAFEVCVLCVESRDAVTPFRRLFFVCVPPAFVPLNPRYSSQPSMTVQPSAARATGKK